MHPDAPAMRKFVMGLGDISVTMITYTHQGMDAKEEMVRLQKLEEARREVEKTTEKAQDVKQNMLRVI